MARDIASQVGLAAALQAEAVEMDKQVMIEFGDNRFNDQQVITSSGTKQTLVGMSTLEIPPLGTVQFWRAEDAFNNKNRLGMKWLVCDQGATVVPIADGTGFRAIPLKDGDFERGWWSSTGGSGWVQSVWPVGRLVNRITLYTMEGYPNANSVTVEYQIAGGGWTTAFSGSLSSSVYINSWDFAEVLVTGLKVTVGSTYGGDARVSELQGLYVKDISDRIITLDVTEVREEYDQTVPVGTTAANSFAMDLDNTDNIFDPFGGSPYGPYITEGNKVTVSFGANTAGPGIRPAVFKYLQMGVFYTDEWTLSTDAMTARCTGRDYSKYLQENSFFWSKTWANVTAGEVIKEVLMMDNIPFSSITVDELGLNKFPVLYIKQVPPWSFMGEIALADQGMFGFDSFGNFHYRSYTTLPNSLPAWTLAGDTNIVSATITTRLYINKMTVKINPLLKAAETGLWAAPSPTILSWAKLSGSIGPTDTTINVQGAPNQPDGNLTNNNWPVRGGLVFLPTITTMLLGTHTVPVVTGGELIRYGTRTDSQFQNCERGILYTKAAAHSDGAYIGEGRLFNMEFSNSPALTINYPYVTAIDTLLVMPDEITKQAHVIFFTYDGMGGQLCVGNIANFYTLLEGSGPTMNQFLTNSTKTNVSFRTLVSGVAMVPLSKQKVQDTVVNPTAANNDLIRRYGKNEITIDNPWVQTLDLAQTLVDAMIEQYKVPRRIFDVDCTGEIVLETGDFTTVSNLSQFGLLPAGEIVNAHVIGVKYSYDGGLKTTYTLREVHLV